MTSFLCFQRAFASLFRAGILALVISILSFPAHSQDDDPINIDASLVVLNAAILDAAGKPVSGLKQDHFKVFENGVEQQISFFAAEETPFAAVILIDTSGSMEERLSMARSAAIRFLDGLRPDDTAAIFRFDSKVEQIQDFSNSRDITHKIFDLRSKGMTALNDAVYEAAMQLEKRTEKRRAIILLSDGMDTQSGRSADRALKAALAADAVIYAVDMSNGTMGGRNGQNQSELKNFAEKSGGTFVAAPGGPAMREAFKAIVEDLGVQYTVGYQPANTVRDGKWRAIELRVGRPNLKIRTRKGYHAEKLK